MIIITVLLSISFCAEAKGRRDGLFPSGDDSYPAMQYDYYPTIELSAKRSTATDGTILADSSEVSSDKMLKGNMIDNAANQLMEAMLNEGLLDMYAADIGRKTLEQQNNTIRIEFRKLTITIIILILALTAMGYVYMLKFRKQRIDNISNLENQIRDIRDSLPQYEIPAEEVRTPPTQKKPTQKKRRRGKRMNDEKFIKLVTEAVLSSPNMAVSVEILATQMNMSTQTFRRRIVSATNLAPRDFLNKIKMQKAVELLNNEPDLSVAQIASRCGFTEASSFIRSFQNAYNMSPTQYKKAGNG